MGSGGDIDYHKGVNAKPDPSCRLDWWRSNAFTVRIKRNQEARESGQHMPTILRTGPYRFYFYSHETNEPPHVHVDRDDWSAKFWLQPVALARNLGFSPKELRRLQKLVIEHQADFMERWHGHFGAEG